MFFKLRHRVERPFICFARNLNFKDVASSQLLQLCRSGSQVWLLRPTSWRLYCPVFLSIRRHTLCQFILPFLVKPSCIFCLTANLGATDQFFARLCSKMDFERSGPERQNHMNDNKAEEKSTDSFSTSVPGGKFLATIGNVGCQAS